MFFLLAPYIALLACLTGLWSATYIHRKKRAKTKLLCPLQANCEKVIHSTHATTFTIPNELLGIVYYVLLGTFYALITIFPSIFSILLMHHLIILMTIGGVLFSGYLVVIQIRVLHAWCSWCLLSALSNVVLGWCAYTVFFVR